MRFSIAFGAAFAIASAVAMSGCTTVGQCTSQQCSADATISDAVRSLIAQAPEFGGANQISLQTVSGVVYLRGLLSTPYQVSEAGSIAQRAPGVVAVQNLLSVDNSR